VALAGFTFRVPLHALMHEAATDGYELLDCPQFVAQVVTLLGASPAPTAELTLSWLSDGLLSRHNRASAAGRSR
jgi:hypothetical protein